MNILFTICGRAGSKGLKNKNLKKMNGVPLVYYTLAVIKLYLKRHPDDKIIIALNTDSNPLIEIVKRQSVVKDVQFIQRKEELAGDKVAKFDVIRDTYLTACKDKTVDVVIDLDLTSPLRTVTDIESTISVYLFNNDYDLITSVVQARRSPYFNMVEKKDDGYYRKICNSNYSNRQDVPISYELNASIYAYRPTFLESEIKNTILDYRCGISIMKDYLVLDIDSDYDFQMMEFLHKYYWENDNGIKEVYEMARTFIS